MMNDLISRQAAIDAMEESKARYFDRRVIIGKMQDIINGLPSVQPKPSTEIQEILNYLDTTLHPIVSPDNWNVYAELHDMVSRLPSAQQWIPCSERLPEVGRCVLFSVGGIYVAEGCLREDGDWTQFRWNAIQRKDMVGAWKPLDEPWRGEEHEHND